MASTYYLGKRLSFSSATCTLRYTGPVQGTEGEWLGVEWDDPARGKHDGEHNGVRYFICQRQHPIAASFVRPNRPQDEPLGFLDALRQKYASTWTFSDDQTAVGWDHQRTNQPIKWGGKTVEEVGFEKIRQQQARLLDLRIVLLDGSHIAGPVAQPRIQTQEERTKALMEISHVCPSIIELDLSWNLIESWADVVDICGQLRELQSLRLNGNRFVNLDFDSDDLKTAASFSFGGVKELELEETLLSWEMITNLSASFRLLSTLSASSNQLACLKYSLTSQTIVTLVLEHNNFTALSDLRAISRIPTLENLRLGHNRISHTSSVETISTEDNSFRFMETLAYVDLSYNVVSSWEFINELPNIVPGLTGLRVAHNPLYAIRDGKEAMGVDESFMLTLARIPLLKTLNYSVIRPSERQDAELYYLMRIAREIEEVAEGQQAEAIRRHPRYEALCQLYGPPTITRKALNGINPNSLEARLINFTFTFRTPEEVSENGSSSVVKARQIPRSFDIYRLKGIVGRLFGLRPMSTRLIWETGEWDPLTDNDDIQQDPDDDDVGIGDVTKAKWARRELELTDGTREVGSWIWGREAQVRIELRR